FLPAPKRWCGSESCLSSPPPAEHPSASPSTPAVDSSGSRPRYQMECAGWLRKESDRKVLPRSSAAAERASRLPSALIPTSALFSESKHFTAPFLTGVPAPRARLTASRGRLAHFPLHPAVQDRFTQFPTVAEFKRGNFAFRDVTVQRIRRDAQIL